MSNGAISGQGAWHFFKCGAFGCVYHCNWASGGKSYVLKAAPKLEVLAQNFLDAAEKNERTLSGPSPAVSGGRIFLRGPKVLICIGTK
jgi:hypothetical protein